MLKKSPSQEQLHQMGQYLAWSISRTGRFKFVQMKCLGHKWPHHIGLNFYIVIYREMLKKCSSKELLHQIGQYFAWSFPRTRTFKLIQIKSLGSCI